MLYEYILAYPTNVVIPCKILVVNAKITIKKWEIGITERELCVLGVF